MLLEIKGESLSYRLELNHKINILKGKGAIHKSFINKILKSALSLPEFDINCDKEVVFIDSPIPKDTLIGYDNYLLIIDESATLVGQKITLYNSEEFKSIMYKSNSIYILIKRNKNIDIKYGADQVYTFDKYIEKDGVITLLKYYDIEPLNRKNKYCLSTEDSGAGLRYFIQNNVDIDSFEGQKNLLSYIKKGKHKDKLILYDLGNIDPSFDVLYKDAENGICDICNRHCFEQQLLHSSFIINSDYKDRIINYHKYIDLEKFKTTEKYFEYLYKEVSLKLLKHNYNKSDLSDCHYLSCTKCDLNYKCILYTPTINSKFNDFLKQNGLEYLVNHLEQHKVINSSFKTVDF